MPPYQKINSKGFFVNPGKKKRNTPLLSREREYYLAERWQNFHDENALHELIVSYGRLVGSIAFRYRNYGLSTHDLTQEGNIGLLQAAQKFQPDKGVRFSTYANWWVRAAMQDHILRNWSIVRTGTTAAQKSLFFNFRRLKNKITSCTSGYLPPEHKQQIADKLGVAYEEVETMEGRLSGPDHSLNSAIGDSGEEQWQDLVADGRLQPDEAVIDQEDTFKRRAWLKNALSYLSERELRIIGDRRLKEETVTLEELGNELGISKERVRQIEQKALNKLKTILVKNARIKIGDTVFSDT